MAHDERAPVQAQGRAGPDLLAELRALNPEALAAGLPLYDQAEAITRPAPDVEPEEAAERSDPSSGDGASAGLLVAAAALLPLLDDDDLRALGVARVTEEEEDGSAGVTGPSRGARGDRSLTTKAERLVAAANERRWSEGNG